MPGGGERSLRRRRAHIAYGPYKGVGRDNPNESPTASGFAITPGQRADLVAFLESLMDRELLGAPHSRIPG